MSVAFTREDSAQTAQDVTLPDRPISPHPNFVTETGWKALEAAVAHARAAVEAGRHIEDPDERRHAGELAMRDLRYFSQRLESAQIRPAPVTFEAVAFGHRVTIQRDDGRRQTYRIVGEDEADPHNDSVSYVSPLARALIGKAVGDVVALGDHEIEILAIA
jgi:transcription elongation GreA/GreB family factor